MADYINSNILSQSYVHVEPEWLNKLSDKDKKKFVAEIERKVTSFSEERIKFFLDDGVVIEISFKEGSIRAWVTTYGPILLLIGSTITNYSSFRESIGDLVSDVRQVATIVNSEVIFQSKSSKKEILHVESRKGIIGSIKRINDKIDGVSNRLKRGDCSATLINEELLHLHGLILELFSNIKDQKDKKHIATALHDGISQLNVKKGRFKFNTQVDTYMYQSLLDEKAAILKDLSSHK